MQTVLAHRESSRKWYMRNAEYARRRSRARYWKARRASEFWSTKKKADAVARVRKHNLKAKYDLTVEEWDRLFEKQNRGCAICGRDPRGKHRNNQRLSVDHDHKTDRVRGLLCFTCNSGLGKLGDNAEAIQRVLNYLAPK